MLQPTATQKKSTRKKLTEGNYVSLERICRASKEVPEGEEVVDDMGTGTGTGYHHRWDMMTLSTAGGITRLAPKRVEHKETLKAVAADVEYVVKYIAEMRQKRINGNSGERERS